jgi:hypothetical protein
LETINSWTGYYFLPRAYGITLDANLHMVRGESAAYSSFEDSFSSAIVAYSDSNDVSAFMESYSDITSEPSCETTTLESDYIFEIDTTEEPLAFKLLERQGYPPPLSGIRLDMSGTLYDIESDGSLDLEDESGSHTITLLDLENIPLSDYTVMVFELLTEQASCANGAEVGVCQVDEEFGICLKDDYPMIKWIDPDWIPVMPNCESYEGHQLDGCTCFRTDIISSGVTDENGVVIYDDGNGGTSSLDIGAVPIDLRIIVRETGGTVPVFGSTIRLYSDSIEDGVITTLTDEYGLALFDMETEFPDMTSASAFVFDEDDNFLSAINIDVSWTITCVSDCSITASVTSPTFEIKRFGENFNGKVKVSEYTTDDPGPNPTWDEYYVVDSEYDVIDGIVTFSGVGTFEHVLGGIPSDFRSKQFLLEFHEGAVDETPLLGTLLEVYYDKDNEPSPVTFVLSDPIVIVNTTSTGTFVGRSTCNVQSQIEMPREITIDAPDCNSMVVYDGIDVIPYQVISPTAGGCRILIIPSESVDTVDIYHSLDFSGFNYDADWGLIETQEEGRRYIIYNDLIEAIYDTNCWEKGPCIYHLATTQVTPPDTSGWVGKGIMWDDADIDEDTMEVAITVDGPLKKCMKMSYEAYAPYVIDCVECGDDQPSIRGKRTQAVDREICIYKDIPSIFENFYYLQIIPDEQPPVEHTIVQSVYPTTMSIYDGLLWDSIPSGTEGGGLVSDRILWNNQFAIIYNTSSEFSYNMDPRGTVTSDSYISDLWTSYRDIFSTIADSSTLAAGDDFLDFETIAACSADVYKCSLIDNDGSLEYYSKSWLHSGTSLNCDYEGLTNYEKVYGTTCGSGTNRGELELSFGIQRTGSHLLKFSTVEEVVEEGGYPSVKLLNSMGGEARLVDPFKCTVTGNSFNCIMTEDEKGIELNLARQGYVVNCMVDHENYRELNTRYFNPYIMPMSWDVEFEILVNPYLRQPVPIYVEERSNYLAATTCGDWICQENEHCYTCPGDCPPIETRFEPEVTE